MCAGRMAREAEQGKTCKIRKEWKENEATHVKSDYKKWKEEKIYEQRKEMKNKMCGEKLSQEKYAKLPTYQKKSKLDISTQITEKWKEEKISDEQMKKLKQNVSWKVEWK